MSTGLVLGKFLPPHKGHEFLINYAKERSDKLYIIIDCVSDNVIPAKIRASWMKKICPMASVLTLQKILPQYPHEAEDFWEQWQEELQKILPEKIDFVFASETYGFKLAEILGAKFEMVDLERKTVEISASKIRKNPFKYWDFISDTARPFFVKKVCIFGPESTGKSTLTEKLAEHFNTAYVEEFARQVIEARGGNINYDDMTTIAKGHNDAVSKGLLQADKLLFVDTDAITSKIWSLKLFGKYPKILDDIIEKADYDLYLLLDTDVPWVDDIVRYFPENRKEFFETCEAALKKYNKNYKIIRGDFDKRFEKAVETVEENFYAW